MKYSSAIVAATVIVFTLLLAGNISAAVFTVTNTNDSGPGSLRQAILDSYGNNQNDVINFDPGVFSTPQTITLTSGHLTILTDDPKAPVLTNLTINGPGAQLLTINGNNQSRIFTLTWRAQLIISGVTMTGGNGTSGGSPTSTSGGAIMIEAGRPGYSLILSNSVIAGNSASFGGALYGGSSLITNSAILNNTATSRGGGLYAGNLDCINCTISGNTAFEGGGIYIASTSARVTNATITSNTAATGGGIASDSFTSLYLKNSIVAKNTSTNVPGSDMKLSNYQPTGPNIISTVCCSPTPGPQDLVNVDPRLDPQLRFNGSAIPSYALRADSPAVDRGDNCVLTGCVTPPVTTDQRGIARPQDGDGNGSAIVDIGAFEISAAELAIIPARPDLSSADDTGVSNTDNITRSQTLHFQLDGLISGATVELYRNGILFHTFVAAGSSASFNDFSLPPDARVSYYARQIVGGVESLHSASADITVDNTGPFSTLYQPANQADPAASWPIRFVIGFSEPVVGLTGSHISLAGSTAGVSSAVVTLSPGTVFPSYNISITGITDGRVVATLPGNLITDAAGNLNWPSSSPDNSVIYDNVRPSVTVNQSAGQADPTSTTPVNFSVVFSEHVTGFDGSDVSLTGSTAGVSSTNIIVTGSGATYNVAVSNITSSGTVRASVPANRVQDILGKPNFASTSTDNTITFNRKAASYDFDGDGRADVSVFRPSEGNWYLSQSLNGFSQQNFGLNGDLITPGDFDGDGKTDLAIFRPSTGAWWYKSTIDSGFYTVQFGMNGDIPLAEDFNGDGRADFVIYRPANSTWYRLGSNGQYAPIAFGTAGDIPLVADMDGDGKADPTIYRPSTGTWWYASSINGLFYALQWGTATDIPTPGDYDGDGRTDPAYFRPSSGEWFIVFSGTNYTTSTATAWGTAGDRPTPADYDGDGKADLAIYRPSNGMWFELRSTSGFFSQQFGLPGDKAIPNAFIP